MTAGKGTGLGPDEILVPGCGSLCTLGKTGSLYYIWGHLPEWLNMENKKLHIARHEDYIPEKFLPVFNSNVLEIYMHRIEGLSEQFVYFNDDMFLTKAVRSETFFVEGKVRDMLAFQPIVANPSNPVMSHLYLNNTLVLSHHFNKREHVRQNPRAYFKIGYPPLYFFYNLLEMAFPLYTGFYTVHGPSPFLMSTFRELWEKEGEALKKMSSNRFRNETDLTPYLFREWQKLTGNFYPANILRDFCYYNLSNDIRKLVKGIRQQKYKMVCINDGQVSSGFQSIKKTIADAFQQILPNPSSFEKEDVK